MVFGVIPWQNGHTLSHSRDFLYKVYHPIFLEILETRQPCIFRCTMRKIRDIIMRWWWTFRGSTHHRLASFSCLLPPNPRIKPDSLGLIVNGVSLLVCKIFSRWMRPVHLLDRSNGEALPLTPVHSLSVSISSLRTATPSIWAFRCGRITQAHVHLYYI